MKKLLIICFLIISRIASAQDTTILSSSFNQQFYQDSTITTCYSSLELEDGYIISTMSLDEDTTSIDLIKIDLMGNKLWQKPLIADTSWTALTISGLDLMRPSSNILKIDSNEYVLFFNRIATENYIGYNIGRVHFTGEGEVLNIDIWDDGIDGLNSAIFKFIPTNDGYVGVGYYNYPNLPSRGYVVKMNAYFEREWNWHEGLEKGLFASVYEEENGNIIVAGRGENTGTGSDLYALRFSSNGELLDDYTYFNEFDDIGGEIYPYLENKYILVGGGWDINDFEHPRKNIVILLSELFNSISFYKHPSPLGNTMGLADLVFYPDGSFVGFNEKETQVTDTTTYNTDSITLMWYSSPTQFDSMKTFLVKSGVEHGTYDLQQTSDGGFLFTGFVAWPAPYVGYALKLGPDLEYCFPSNCSEVLSYEVSYPEDTLTVVDTTMQDTMVVIDSIPDGMIELQDIRFLKITPNPAIDKTSIEYPPMPYEQELILGNSVGNIVKQWKIAPNSDQMVIDVSSLPAGVYFYRLGNAIGKLLVVR